MPLFNSFSESAARGLGVGSGKIMPPDVPVIVTPTGGSTLTTTTTAEVTFTSIATTYPILKYQYRVGVGGSWVDVSTSPFTISGLTEGTPYDIYMKAIDITNVESDITAARSFTTKSTVQIQAPTPILSSPSVTHPAKITINVTYSAGVASGGYSMSTRQYALKIDPGGQPSAGSTDWTTLPYSSGTVPATQTTGTSPVNLLTNTTYYVYFKYTDTNGAISYTTNSIKTAAENAPGVPAASTLLNVGTSSATLTRGDATAGTYDRVYQFRYWESNAAGSVAATGTWQSMTSNPTTLNGLKSNTYYDAEVKAVSVSPGTTESSPRGYSVTLTDPDAPGTPTISWNNMSANSSVTASVFIPFVANGDTLYVEVSQNNFSTYSTLNTTSNIGAFGSNSSGWIFNWTCAFNTTYYFRAYYKNRVNVNSNYTNILTWNTPQKGLEFVAFSAQGGDAEFTIAATNSSVAPCSPGDYSITFGYVPPSSNDVGYINITSMGIQLKRFSQYTVSSTFLYFSYPGGTFGLGPADAPEGFDPTPNSLRYTTLNIGGSSLSGQTFRLNHIWVEGAGAGSASAARFYSVYGGCYPNGNNAYYGKRMYVLGTRTGPGSSPGYF